MVGSQRLEPAGRCTSGVRSSRAYSTRTARVAPLRLLGNVGACTPTRPASGWTIERARLEGVRDTFDDEHLHDESEEREPLASCRRLDQHQADIGTETFEREKDLSILEQVEAELADVEHALQPPRRRHLRHVRGVRQAHRRRAPRGACRPPASASTTRRRPSARRRSAGRLATRRRRLRKGDRRSASRRRCRGGRGGAAVALLRRRPAPPARAPGAGLAAHRPPRRPLGARSKVRGRRATDERAGPARGAVRHPHRRGRRPGARQHEGRHHEGGPDDLLHRRRPAARGPGRAGHPAGRRAADGAEPGRAGRSATSSAPTPRSSSSTGTRCRSRPRRSARCTGR